MGKNNGEIEQAIKELISSQKKTEEEINKLLRSQKNTNKKVADLTDSWGQFVEGIVEPFIPKLFKEYGIKIIGTDQRAIRRRNGREMEIDILAVSNEEDSIVAAVEAKSTLKVNDVNNFMSSLNNFFDFFPEYGDRQLVGVVCGIRLIRDVAKYAERKGLYVLGPSDNNVMPLNKKNFKPKRWK